jgi:SpoVK/Ycf46/Vps4 family AAA+-type ATPase
VKIGLLHLSDIHIRSAEDKVLQRAPQIIDAIKNLEPDVLDWIVVVSGDVAYSGQADEYDLAYDLFAALEAEMKEKMVPGHPMRLVAVPGNHDLLLVDSGLRDLVLDKVKADFEKGADPAIRELCCGPQQNFFRFRDLFSEGLTVLDELRYQYTFDVAGKRVVFQCFNTSWLSTKAEVHGSLGFPLIQFPNQAPADLAITLFHHPYSWLEPENARGFRKKVEQVSDIILTGHEHEASRSTQETAVGEVNQYVEGTALQSNGASEDSAFNVIICDLQTMTQRFANFTHSESLYRETALSSEGWQPFQVNRLRATRGFAFREEYARHLADPGVGLTHRDRANVSLQDVYVFPDLRQDDPVRDIHFTIRSDNFVEQILAHQRVVITAPEQAGKTALAKQLALECHRRGMVPVLLRGGEVKARNAERLERDIEDAFLSQYEERDVEVFRQLDRGQKIIVIDDYDDIPRKEVSQDLLHQLCSRASRVILLADDLAHGLSAVVYGKAEEEVRFSHFKIQEFGELLRSRLVLKWFQLGQGEVSDEALAHRVTAVVATVNAVIGTNFVPAYPVYVLSILQAEEAATPFDLNAGTHAYFYEHFIKARLAQTGTVGDYDIRKTYLANLAYQLFKGGRRVFEEGELRRLHEAFEEDRQLKLSFLSTIRQLEEAKVLTVDGESIGFKYRYAYYYFAALYISDNISVTEVRNDIVRLADQLHVEENANILLFLAHHARDPFIISTILEAAKRAFAEQAPEQLREVPAPLKRLGEEFVAVVYIEDDPWRVRDELLRERDEMMETEPGPASAATREAAYENAEDTVTPIARFNVAVKAIQIMGQILKNFPGSLRGEEKEVLLRECFGTAERTVAAFFAFLDGHEDQLLVDIVSVFRDTYPKRDEDWLTERARKTVFGLTQLFCYGIIRRVSQAVGSPDLFETYRRVIEADPAPTRLLFGASIHLDHVTQFPVDVIEDTFDHLESHMLGSALLRQLVVHHFRIFPVQLPVRQRITTKLGIEVRKALPPANPKDKRLK